MSLATEPTLSEVQEWLDTANVVVEHEFEHGYDMGERLTEDGELRLSIHFDPYEGVGRKKNTFFEGLDNVTINKIHVGPTDIMVVVTIHDVQDDRENEFVEYLRENIFDGGDVELEAKDDRVEFRSYYIADSEIRRTVNDDRACLTRVYPIEYRDDDGVAVQVLDTEQ